MPKEIHVSARPYINGHALVTISTLDGKEIMELILPVEVDASDEKFIAVLSELFGREVYNV